MTSTGVCYRVFPDKSMVGATGLGIIGPWDHYCAPPKNLDLTRLAADSGYAIRLRYLRKCPSESILGPRHADAQLPSDACQRLAMPRPHRNPFDGIELLSLSFDRPGSSA